MRAVKIAEQMHYEAGDEEPFDLDHPALALVEAPLLWDVEAVKDAIVRGYIVNRETVRRPGPRGYATYWPAFPPEMEDIWEMRRTGSNTVGRMKARIQRTAAEIAQSDATMSWPMTYLADVQEHKRTALFSLAFGRSCGVSDGRIAQRRGLARSTMQLWRDSTARLLAERLNRAGVTPW